MGWAVEARSRSLMHSWGDQTQTLALQASAREEAKLQALSSFPRIHTA